MRPCPDCHKLVSSQLRFCDNCGYPFPESPGEAAELEPVVSETNPTGSSLASPELAGACEQCGHPYLAGENICNQCGAELERDAEAALVAVADWWAQPTLKRDRLEVIAAPEACPVCGRASQPGDEFCQNCGARLTGEPSPEARAPEAQMHVSLQLTPRLEQHRDNRAEQGQPSPEETILAATIPAGMPSGPAAGLTGALLVEASYIFLPLPPGKAEALLGRADPQEEFFPDIDLSQHGGELGGVSRKHARLLAEGDQVFIEDLHSTNFTLLNQIKLQPVRRYPLKDGDEIRLGRVLLTYHARWSG